MVRCCPKHWNRRDAATSWLHVALCYQSLKYDVRHASWPHDSKLGIWLTAQTTKHEKWLRMRTFWECWLERSRRSSSLTQTYDSILCRNKSSGKHKAQIIIRSDGPPPWPCPPSAAHCLGGAVVRACPDLHSQLSRLIMTQTGVANGFQ